MSKRNFAALVPIPPDNAINSGLHPARQATMLKLLGRPGRLTQECSQVTNTQVRAMLVIDNLTPHMRVTGVRPMVDALRRAFKRVYERDPELWAACRTAGMTCCRAVRGSKTLFSNHSWGTAIDLYFGDDVVPMGEPVTQQGVLLLYPYFHAESLFWLAESSRPDAMHVEASEELMWQWHSQGKF
jgi:hypothetical protein